MRMLVSNFITFLGTVHKGFFLLLLVLTPTQLGLHTWPSWSIVLGRRVDYLSPTLYLTDILVFITVSSYILQTKRSPIKTFLSKKSAVIAIFGIFLTLNIIMSVRPPVSLYSFLKLTEYALLIWYMSSAAPSLRNIRRALACAAAWSVALALLQLVLQHSVGGLFWYLGERSFTIETLGIAKIQAYSLWNSSNLILRPYATFPHPNVLGGFLTVLLPLLLFTQRTRLKIIMMIIIFAGIIATHSRSALIVSIIILCTAVLFSKKNLENIYPFFIAAVFALFLTLTIFVTSIAPSTIRQAESVFVRSELAHASIAMWKRSPLVGTGLGTFLVILPSYMPTRTISFLQPVHNAYLMLLTETGLLGLLIIFMCLWKGMRMLIRFRIPALSIAVCATVLLAATDHYFLTLQQGQLTLVVLVGTCFIVGARKQVAKEAYGTMSQP